MSGDVRMLSGPVSPVNCVVTALSYDVTRPLTTNSDDAPVDDVRVNNDSPVHDGFQFIFGEFQVAKTLYSYS